MKSKRKMAEERIAQLESAVFTINRRIIAAREETAAINRERAQTVDRHIETIARLKREHAIE